jgi:uncharacterized protein (DUF2147 family)
MQHHACAAVIGLLTAAFLAPVSPSHAASADPTGYWIKPDAERESKIHVFKCGKGRSQLCAKIAWLKEPNDRKGLPLHDIRNQDPSQRGRPIVGLAIFTGLTPSAPSTWTGKIYNPEDGHTYSATLTVVSRKQILLKGCKAWLLCGERQWLRTTAPEEVKPPVPAEGTEQIEASVTPQMPTVAPSEAASVAATEPVPAPSGEATISKASIDAAAVQEEMQAMTAPQAPSELLETAVPKPAPSVRAVPAPATHEFAVQAEPPAEIDASGGYRFLTVSISPDTAARLSGENVSSLFIMTEPIEGEAFAPAKAQPAAATGAAQSGASAAHPAPKPKAKPKPIATAAAKPAPKTEAPAKPAEQAAPPPPDANAVQADAESTDALPAETAEAAFVEPVPLTRRQRRLLRRQQQEGDLPWLR